MRKWQRGLGAALVAGGIAAQCLILPAATAQAAQNSQGGCKTYTVQGYNVGVCVNDRNTGDTAYPDIWVNKSAGTSNCGINLSVWDDHNNRYTSKELSCGTGEQPGNASAAFGSPTLAHAYARLDLGGKAYSIGDSPSVFLDSSQPTAYYAEYLGSLSDPINLAVIVPGGNADAVLDKALLSQASGGWSVNTCYNPLVVFNAGTAPWKPNASYSTDNNTQADVKPFQGCGTVNVPRDHLRVWAAPGDKVLYIAASVENPNKNPTKDLTKIHTVVSFDNGRTQLVTALAAGLAATGKHSQEFDVQRYAAGSVNGVKYNGTVAYFDVS